MKHIRLLPLLVLAGLPVSAADSPAASQNAEARVELVVRGDDMGVCQTGNEACIRAYRDGIVRSVEVIVPGAWLLDAVKLLQENPGLDVGVHLCLTSEWERCKWRPLTHARSLADANGFFRPMTSQRKDFPPDTGVLEANPNLAEVEAELRAQIELLRRHVPRVSHVSAHMGTATATPALRAITQRLAAEYHLRLEGDGVRFAGGFTGRTATERVESLRKLVTQLAPGRWLLIEHPGLDTPEMRALGHLGYEYVAEERDAVTKAFTDPRVREIVKARGIRLMSYAELQAGK